MDETMELAPTPPTLPGWFEAGRWLVLASAVAFGLMFVSQVNSEEARIVPGWMVVLGGVAAVSGLAGAIALIRRSRLAVGLLGVALAATIAHFSALLVDPGLSRLVTADMLVVPAVICLIACGPLWLALVARRRGWLA